MRIPLPLLGLRCRGQPYTSTGATTLNKGACYNPRGLPTALAGFTAEEAPIPVPRLVDHLDQVRPLVRSGRLGLITDFDGTVSAIAPTPDEAVVSPRAAESLRHLTGKLALVCVISGRAVEDLREKVGVEGVTYVGNHGAEYLDSGGLFVDPCGVQHRDAVKAAFDHLKARVAVPGLVWQDKGYSASCHYRLAEEPSQAKRVLTSALSSIPGVHQMDVFWGKMVLELRASGSPHKGHALRKLATDRHLDAVVVIGDDVTDVDALATLRDLRARDGLRGLGVAVLYQDSPAELMNSADYGLDGVSEVEVFLEWLDAVSDYGAG